LIGITSIKTGKKNLIFANHLLENICIYAACCCWNRWGSKIKT
jgi:hypothetical protein